MFNDRDRKFLLWAVPIIMIGGLLLNVLSGTSLKSIQEGLQYANTSEEQKALAKKIVAERSDSMIDPASGYAICGERRKYVLAEPLVQITMCGQTITGKESDIKSLQAANDYCQKTKNVCIKVYGGGLRSNLGSQSAANKRKGKGFIGGLLQSTASKSECTSSHNMGQAFDVLNFAASHDCLVKEGFNGGWAGIIKDGFHYSKPEHGGVPRLSGRAAAARKAANWSWCLINGPCRKNNITGGGAKKGGWRDKAKTWWGKRKHK